MFGIDELPDVKTQTIAQRNTWWAMLVTRLIIQEKTLRDGIPDNATIYVLPSNDVELCAHNRRLVDEHPDATDIVLVEVTVQPPRRLAIRSFMPTGPSRTYAYA